MTFNNQFFLLNVGIAKHAKGNTTPVCLLQKSLSAKQMQTLATDFNLPVCVFVFPPKKGVYFIRYFTPTQQINACGHGSIAATYVLQKEMNQTQIQFKTIKNKIVVASSIHHKSFIQYPKYSYQKMPVPSKMKQALGLIEIEESFHNKELDLLFIRVKNESIVKALNPNFELLVKSSNTIKEVVVMCSSNNKNYQITLRTFCPWIGINEDPVTGSIHAVLGVYWQQQLNVNSLTVFQASPRGGLLSIKANEQHILLGGNCAIIAKGTLQ